MTSDLQQIQKYYEHYFGRMPDAHGLRTYAEHLEAGVSLATLHRAIATSDEARQVAAKMKPGEFRYLPGFQAEENNNSSAALSSEHGAPSTSKQSSDLETYLNWVYLALLGRHPDEAGLAAYSQAIANGLSLDQLVSDIFFSSEARQKNSGSPAFERVSSLKKMGSFKPLRARSKRQIAETLAAECQRLWALRLASGQHH